MRLEDVIEARLAGHDAAVAADDESQFAPAIAAHNALVFAVGETIGWPTDDRVPPGLPADYELLDEVGRGGMGVVYRARQRSLGREVAVKVLRSTTSASARQVQRFLDEARHMARLRHPNIVAVHEVGRADGEPYLTMDFIRGQSLARRLADGPLTPAQTVMMLKQVASAVVHAHEHGIVHRDLKPGNVLIDAAELAYVTDFGLARDVSADSSLTRSGELLGTPSYMSPEQARGQSALIGEATDVHALGAILYESLTGRPPYGDDAAAAVFARLLHDDPKPPRTIDRRIPKDLETICLKCLEKGPARRYPTARAVFEDLRRFEAGEPILARRPGPMARVGRVVHRQWKLGLTAVVTAVVAVGLAVAFLDRSVDDLRGWGQEREAAGDLAGAVDVYRRAWQKAAGAERDVVAEDLIRCGRATDDPKVALAAAADVIRTNPRASFGRHDYMIAQGVVTELRAKYEGRGVGNVPVEAGDQLRLAETRLRVFLAGTDGTPEERRAATESLSAVTHALSDRWPTPTGVAAADDVFPLPTGAPEELERLATDVARTPWDRGVALYSLARQLRANGDVDRARVSAAEAFDRLRRAYPIFRGAAASVVISPDTGSRIGREAPEARMLRDADDLARDLDPARPNVLRGGIRFHIDGVTLPPDVTLDINVHLTDASAGPADPRFRPHRRVPFRGLDAEIGVADGTYSLRLADRSASHGSGESARFVRRLELDFDRAPTSITVAGEFVDVTVPARIMADVALLGPAPGGPLDPTTDFLRWEPIAGATTYRVTLAVQRDRAGTRSLEALEDVTTAVPRVCVGALTDRAAARRLSRLESGVTGTWAVEAFDAAGRKIAVSPETLRPFLVTRSSTDRPSP